MSLEVRPVSTRRELNTFIKLPWRIYRNEPKWVAPLLMEWHHTLSRLQPAVAPSGLGLHAELRPLNCSARARRVR
jgi:hypothetical protein